MRVVREHKAVAPKETPASAFLQKEKHPKKEARYIEAVGRRKTAIARVRIFPGDGKMTVNEKDVKKYFVSQRQWTAALSPFVDLKIVTFDAISKNFSDHCRRNIHSSSRNCPELVSDVSPDEIINLFIDNKGKEIEGIINFLENCGRNGKCLGK